MLVAEKSATKFGDLRDWSWSRNNFREVFVHQFHVLNHAIGNELQFNCGNAVGSTYELMMLGVLSTQVLWVYCVESYSNNWSMGYVLKM